MPTSTATILFADVAGSTELRARIGEASADKLFLDIERRLTAAVERRSGRVLKTAGDGIMAAFESASEAVNAAVDIQRAAARRDDGVQFYVGIASGDVSWEGNDCFGLPVITAARLESRAEPGQILVSQIVRLLAGERAGAAFASVGPLELKGLPEPVDSYMVEWEPSSEEDGHESVPLPAVLATPAGFPFVSRRDEWQTLEDAWASVKAGGRRVVLIGGEAGGGKTRLACEFARACHDDGGAVLFGGCDAELVVPYQPWVQALDHLFRTMTPDDVDPDIANDLAVLAPLLPSLERRAQPVAPLGIDADTERYRLFAAVDELFGEASRRWPVVVVLDDLHWASAQTWALLSHLARGNVHSRLLLIGTFRDVGEDMNDPLAAALADLRRVDSATRVRLFGLDTNDVADLVAKTTGQELDSRMRELVSEVTARTLGNAFFVGEMWHHLVATGVVTKHRDRWTLAGSLDASGVPDSIREVVAERLARLPFSVRRLAELVAVGGQRVEHRVLAAATDLVPGELTSALDALTTAGLLEAVERPLLAYQFTHALVRDAVEHGIPATTRAQMHLRIAEALESTHEGDPRPALADLARHYCGAAGLGVAPKAVYYCRRAAEQAISSIAYEDALAHLERALELTPDHSAARAEVLIDICDARARLNQFNESADAAERAFNLARAQNLPRLAAEAAVAYGEAIHIPGLPGDHAITVASEAIELLGDDGSAARAQLEATLALALEHSGRRADAEAARDNALRLSQGHDDHTRTRALQAAMNLEQDPEKLIEWARQAEEVADVTGDKWSLAYATTSYLRALFALGRLEEAQPILERHAAIAQDIWTVTGLFEEWCYRLIIALSRGDFEAAEAAANHMTEVAGGDHPSAAGMYGLQMFAIRREQGRLYEAAPVLELAARQADSGRVWGPGLAMLYVEVGDLDKARVVFDRLAADAFASVPRDSLWPATGSFLGEVCVALDDRRHAPQLYRELARFANLNLMVGMTVCLGPADRVLGGLAALVGDDDGAEQHYRTAAAVAKRSYAPVWLARVQHDWARYLFARGDTARAAALADAALATADRVGMRRLAEQCREIPRIPQLAVVPDYPDRLSAREIEVLKAVAAGCSNREIGERLNISGNTAANHVRAILQKTGCGNRAEAAAYAARLALLD